MIAPAVIAPPEPIEEEERHRLLADLVLHRDRPQESLRHARHCRKPGRNGRAHHKEIALRSRAA